MPILSAKIPEDFNCIVRLDVYISDFCSGMNRSKLKNCAKEILLNGKNAKLSSKVKAGDLIDIFWEENIPDNIEPENIELDIVYEDKNVTVVNKKQGMVTHPASGNWTGTLVNALLYHWGRSAVFQIKCHDKNEELIKRRPGIVHRLDKDTSGLIIAAKNRFSEEWLGLQFKERRVQKDYICIVCGRPPALSGEIKTQIVRDIKNRQRFKAVKDTDEGKFAWTIYHCISSYGMYSLMRVRIKTGRTHQIRVHMKYIGCPVLGDKIYGKTDSLFPDMPLMLHSRQMIIRLPSSDKYTRFCAAVPERFYEVISVLRKKYQREVMKKAKN